jgi:anti-sigma B factor antagonist
MSTGATTTVRCDGDLDIVTAQDLKRRLVALVEPGATLTLDFTAIGFVDSSGLGALVALHHYAKSKGATLVIRAVPDSVRNLFTLTRLDDLFVIE